MKKNTFKNEYENYEYQGDDSLLKKIGTLFLFLLLIGGGAFMAYNLWQKFAAYEELGIGFEADSRIIMLYNLGGKWLVCGLFAVFALAFVWASFKHIINWNKKVSTNI